MNKKYTIKCAHCNGSRKCTCDACWKAHNLNPVYWAIADREAVPCKVCGGIGQITMRSVQGLGGNKSII